MSQVSGWVPGAVPSPWQVGRRTAVSTFSSRVDAERGLGEVELDPDQRVLAAAARGARAAAAAGAAPPPPKNASMMSVNGEAGRRSRPRRRRRRPNGSPPRSYDRRFSGSDRTS